MTREEIVNLGMRAKEERKRLGMTQAEFAKSVGIGFSTLQALELGTSITIGNRVKKLVENYLQSPSQQVEPSNNSSSDNFQALYTSLITKISKIVTEPDFLKRVHGVADLLRVGIDVAAFEVIDKDLKKKI